MFSYFTPTTINIIIHIEIQIAHWQVVAGYLHCRSVCRMDRYPASGNSSEKSQIQEGVKVRLISRGLGGIARASNWSGRYTEGKGRIARGATRRLKKQSPCQRELL